MYMLLRALTSNDVFPNVHFCFFFSLNFLKDIDYEGFKKFMDTYLEIDTPEDVCSHLFLSFVKRPPKLNLQTVEGRSLKVSSYVAISVFLLLISRV